MSEVLFNHDSWDAWLDECKLHFGDGQHLGVAASEPPLRWPLVQVWSVMRDVTSPAVLLSQIYMGEKLRECNLARDD